MIGAKDPTKHMQNDYYVLAHEQGSLLTNAMIGAKDPTKHMQNDYYVLAHEQASRERADLRIQIETLLARDARLEKLVDCLKEFLPELPAPEVHADGHHDHNG
jgi:hypothetical protein